MSCLRAVAIAVTVIGGMDASVRAAMVTVSSAINNPNKSDGTFEADGPLSVGGIGSQIGTFSFTLGTASSASQPVGATPVTFPNLTTTMSRVDIPPTRDTQFVNGQTTTTVGTTVTITDDTLGMIGTIDVSNGLTGTGDAQLDPVSGMILNSEVSIGPSGNNPFSVAFHNNLAPPNSSLVPFLDNLTFKSGFIFQRQIGNELFTVTFFEGFAFSSTSTSAGNGETFLTVSVQDLSAVPEPATILSLGMGGVLLAARAGFRRKRISVA